VSDCTHCRNGFFDRSGNFFFGQDVECVNGVLIDIDEFNEGHATDLIRPVAPCHPMWSAQVRDPDGETWVNDSIERLDAMRLSDEHTAAAAAEGGMDRG